MSTMHCMHGAGFRWQKSKHKSRQKDAARTQQLVYAENNYTGSVLKERR